MREPPRPARPGFTVMEITAVITIAALLALAVMPAMSRFDDASRAAGATEAARLLTFARERAVASGYPVGVRFDTAAHTAELLSIGVDAAPHALTDPLGVPSGAVRLREAFRTEIARVAIPLETAGATGTDPATVWFDHRGRPHARTVSGTHAGVLSADATVRFADNAEIIVHARSGLVEGP